MVKNGQCVVWCVQQFGCIETQLLVTNSQCLLCVLFFLQRRWKPMNGSSVVCFSQHMQMSRISPARASTPSLPRMNRRLIITGRWASLMPRLANVDVVFSFHRPQRFHFFFDLSLRKKAAVLRRMIHLIDDTSIAAELRIVLKRLAALFGTFNLEKHASVLCSGGGYLQASSTSSMHRAVQELCRQLKPDAVALVDAIAPTDFILNSALGRSDGKVYDELQKKFAGSMGQRPSWWKLIVDNPITSHL